MFMDVVVGEQLLIPIVPVKCDNLINSSVASSHSGGKTLFYPTRSH